MQMPFILYTAHDRILSERLVAAIFSIYFYYAHPLFKTPCICMHND